MLEILKRMKVLLSNGWCTGFSATDAEGQKCSSLASVATHFCIIGAIDRACRDTDQVEKYSEVRDYIETFIASDWLSKFNDTHTKEEVVQLIERCIDGASSFHNEGKRT